MSGSCFDGCSQLKEIVFEEGSVLREIGENAFGGCRMNASLSRGM
jgi:hypothetical protein